MRSPVIVALAAALVVRAIGLVAHHFGTDPVGRPISAAPLNTLWIALLYHAAVLTALGASLAAVHRQAGRARALVARLAALILGATMLAGQVDLALLRYLGQNLTPSIVRTYVGSAMLTPELWQPVAQDWPYVARAAGLVAAGWAFLLVGVRTRLAAGQPATGGTSWRTIAALAAAVLGAVPVLSFVGGQRQFVKPPEVALLAALTGESTPTPADEARARIALQRFLDPAGTTVWLDPQFPLVHRPAQRRATAPAGLPDIVLVMVESLRGRDVGYLRPGGRGSVTPNLDRLAGRAVVFPHFIANGFPTAPGFLSLNTGLWSHRRRIITSHFAGTSVDAWPLRLRGLGYHTVWMDGSNPSFDNQLQWARRWYDGLIHDLPENRWLYRRRMSDRVLMRRAIEVVAQHDAAAARPPLLLFVSTAGMHPPFTLSDALFGSISAMGDASRAGTEASDDPQRRYQIVLGAFDAAFGELLQALDRRPRRDNTVIVVTGDHASATGEPIDPSLRGLPTDETVWTSAMIAGPAHLIGPTPRREVFPASQVDVMPTILALVGDDNPTAAMGQDLLDPQVAHRAAVAIRPAGYRLDRAGASMLTTAEGPRRCLVVTPFLGAGTDAGASTPPAAGPAGFQRPCGPGSGFLLEDERHLRAAVDYVSFLIERDRVWPRER